MVSVIPEKTGAVSPSSPPQTPRDETRLDVDERTPLLSRPPSSAPAAVPEPSAPDAARQGAAVRRVRRTGAVRPCLHGLTVGLAGYLLAAYGAFAVVRQCNAVHHHRLHALCEVGGMATFLLGLTVGTLGSAQAFVACLWGAGVAGAPEPGPV